jgi:hypothetical protein
MPAAGLRARKRRLHRVPWRRGRYRTAVTDTIRAAMSMSPTQTGCTDANSRCATCSRTCSATCSCSGAAARSTSGTASAAPASSAAASEQRARCCDQQCRYGGYCNKLGYPDHDDLLRHWFRVRPGNAAAPTMFLRRLKIGRAVGGRKAGLGQELR